MNLTPSEAHVHLLRLRSLLADVQDRDLFVLPAFPSLWVAREQLTGSAIAWGAQDVHPQDKGAFTGDVSAPMLADLGCRYVEVGHPERARDHGETRRLVADKVAAVLRWGMSPIICVGEAEAIDEDAALAETLRGLEASLASVPRGSVTPIVVAYEPEWTIGAGADAAPPERIGRLHRGIRAWLRERDLAASRLIYGGSVDVAVAPDILAQPHVDGLFVGRMALDPDAFSRIATTPLPASRILTDAG
jgi:triosephosphate isomerase